jgi:spermidine synthase
MARDRVDPMLRPPGGVMLERRVGRFGTIEVVERGDGARLYVQNRQIQSMARPDGVSLLPYVQAMRAVLVQAGARRIAVLGAAGGSLGTMLAAAGARPVLIDVNPEAFELAETYFWLPRAVERTVADAARFLSAGSELFDAIVLDAFDGGDMPAHLTTAGFLALARRRLLPQGLLVANAPLLAPTTGRQPRTRVPSLSAGFAAAGFPVTVFEGPWQTCRNALVIGGALPAIDLPMGDEPAETRRELTSLKRR